LESVGITIEAFHKECGKGQFEMPIRFSNVQKMVEDYYFTKMIIKKHFVTRGIVVSYLPKPAADIGIGAHAHFSLWNEKGENCSGDPTTKHKFSAIFESFNAGILKHLPALF